MNLNDFNQSKYLAGRDLPDGGIDVTIAGFEVAKMQDGTSKPALLYSHPQFAKPMLLNKTNRKRLEVIFRTAQTEALIGQRVGLYFDAMVQGPNGDMVGGLRLRPAQPSVPAAPQSFQPGHQPNPLRSPAAAIGALQANPATQGATTAGEDWTQEVPF
jgi:hypothetical protein